MNGTDGGKTDWKHKLLHEFVEYWINVLYLGLFFSVFTNYRRLILAEYQIGYAEYGISLIKALVLAKVVLILDKLSLGRSFEDKPLIFSTLYKAALFTIGAALFSIIEFTIRDLLHGRGLVQTLAGLPGLFTYEWLAGSIVVFSAFIPFFAFKELGRVLGTGRINDLFFRRRTDAESLGTSSESR